MTINYFFILAHNSPLLHEQQTNKINFFYKHIISNSFV